MNTPSHRALQRSIISAAIALGMIACGSSESTAPCTVGSLTVAPSTPTVAVAATTQLAATIASSNCSTTPVATWTSSAQSIATVSSTGLVTGVAAGSAVITATAGGVTGTAALTVNGTPTLTVSSVTPASGATNVRIDSIVRIAFSAAIDPASVTSSTVNVILGGAVVAGTLAVNGSTVTFTPTVPFTEFRSVYTVTATSGVKSTIGNFLAAPSVSAFTTAFGDPSYYYQITNEFIGPAKLLDCYNSTPYDGFLDSVVPTTGERWYLVPVPNRPWTYLKNSFLGDGFALEGASSGSQSRMTTLSANGTGTSGQNWTFTPYGAPYTNGYRLQTEFVPTASFDAAVADGSAVGLRPTASSTEQVWYFKRMIHR